MGPAFFLSLYEIGWGQSKSTWTVVLSPDDSRIKAYPSFQFRLHLIRTMAELDAFHGRAMQDFRTLLRDDGLRGFPERLLAIPTSHASDVFLVRPSSDPDSDPIRKVLTQHLSGLKTGLEAFAVECRSLLVRWCGDSIQPASTREIAELMRRLECDILPNIVPDGTLLGQPASFPGILSASAFYRLNLLWSGGSGKAAALSRRLKLAERLTAKALEVSFVQKAFLNQKPGK